MWNLFLLASLQMHWSLFKYSVSDSILVACVSQVCCELPKVCSELPSIQNPVSVLDSKLENSISLPVKTELDPIQKILLDISSKLNILGNPSIQLSQTACPVVLTMYVSFRIGVSFCHFLFCHLSPSSNQTSVQYPRERIIWVFSYSRLYFFNRLVLSCSSSSNHFF